MYHIKDRLTPPVRLLDGESFSDITQENLTNYTVIVGNSHRIIPSTAPNEYVKAVEVHHLKKCLGMNTPKIVF